MRKHLELEESVVFGFKKKEKKIKAVLFGH